MLLKRFTNNPIIEEAIVECEALEFSLHTIIDLNEMDSFYFTSIKNNIYQQVKQLNSIDKPTITDRLIRMIYISKLQSLFIKAYNEFEEYKRRELDKCIRHSKQDN